MGYNCEMCHKSYKYRKNLLRHLREKHVINYEFWNCVVKDCPTKFIRRDYLYYHLQNVHKFPSDCAKKAALKASRGDDVSTGYYEEISDDDTVLDLINEVDDINSVNQFDVDEFLVEFQQIQNSGDEGNDKVTNQQDDEDIVVISSDEEEENLERTIDVSTLQTVTLVLTITRTVNILNGEIVSSTSESVSYDYYEL